MHLLLGQSGEAYAQALSAGLWALSVPEAKSTLYYTGYITHADGNVAIHVPDETQPVHADADVSAFMPLVTKEGVSQDELDGFAATLEAAKGDRINFLNILQASPSFAPDLRSLAQMEADGWFPVAE